jgi:hypothetical protein
MNLLIVIFPPSLIFSFADFFQQYIDLFFPDFQHSMETAKKIYGKFSIHTHRDNSLIHINLIIYRHMEDLTGI